MGGKSLSALRAKCSAGYDWMQLAARRKMLRPPVSSAQLPLTQQSRKSEPCVKPFVENYRPNVPQIFEVPKILKMPKLNSSRKIIAPALVLGARLTLKFAA